MKHVSKILSAFLPVNGMHKIKVYLWLGATV